ncbi:MAG: WD40/YVTN/BNR-like repeat-containing protein [Nitrososphaerales archaeon]
MTDASGSSKVTVGIGTEQGGLMLISDSGRKKWKKIGPFLKSESVNCLNYDPKSRLLFAATHTNGVLVSKDFGKTWKQSNNGLHVKKTWTIEFDRTNPNTLFAGTQYGHLFKSSDSGSNWEEVSGLFKAPKRMEWGVDWGYGTVGLCIHTIRMDPKRNSRFYIVSSGGGPYRTDDGGDTWSLLNKGVGESCSVGSADVWGLGDVPAKNLEKHLAEVHRCTHKLAISSKDPDVIYQQNHCGVYKSSDRGESWEDISPSEELRHGFPLVLVEDGSKHGALFTIPAYQGVCKKHNSCIKGELAVYRTRNGGKAWEKMTKGIGKKNHNCILRDAMATDRLNPAGVYFGTTTGEVYGSTDLGENWTELLHDAGRVQGISTFFV